MGPNISDQLDAGAQAGFAVAIAVLVLLAGCFSGLTLGLLSLDRLDLEVLIHGGTPVERRRARKLLPLVSNPHWLLVTLVMMNAACMETLPIFLDVLLNPVAAIVLSVSAILLFGEIIPQAICSRHGVTIGAFCAPVVRALMWLCSPISWPLGWMLHLMLGKDDPMLPRQHLKTILHLHGKDAGMGGTLTSDEVNVMSGALELTTKTACMAMTPMAKVFAIAEDAALDDALVNEILATGYSRIPVFREGDRHQMIGLVLVKDMLKRLRLWRERQDPRVRQLDIRPLPQLPAMTPLYDVLRLFKTGQSHLAAVVAPAGISLEQLRQQGTVQLNGELASRNHTKTRSSTMDTLGSPVTGTMARISIPESWSLKPCAGQDLKPLEAKEEEAGGELVAAEGGGKLPPAGADGERRGGGGALSKVWSSLKRRGSDKAASGEETDGQHAAVETLEVIKAPGPGDGWGPAVEKAGAWAGMGAVQAPAAASGEGKLPAATSAFAIAAANLGPLSSSSSVTGESLLAVMSQGQGPQQQPGGDDLVPCGIITLEDVLEELMKVEIVDETDKYLDNEGQLPVDMDKLISELPPRMRRLLKQQVVGTAIHLIRQRSHQQHLACPQGLCHHGEAIITSRATSSRLSGEALAANHIGQLVPPSHDVLQNITVA